MALERSAAIQFARKAFREGMSANAWILEMREQGLGYTRTTMLADWRSVNQLEKKSELLRYVRKDRFPSPQLVAESEWAWKREWAYQVQVESQLAEDQPLQLRHVTILSDEPLTPGMVEAQVVEKWSAWEKYAAEALVTVTPVTAIHAVA